MQRKNLQLSFEFCLGLSSRESIDEALIKLPVLAATSDVVQVVMWACNKTWMDNIWANAWKVKTEWKRMFHAISHNRKVNQPRFVHVGKYCVVQTNYVIKIKSLQYSQISCLIFFNFTNWPTMTYGLHPNNSTCDCNVPQYICDLSIWLLRNKNVMMMPHTSTDTHMQTHTHIYAIMIAKVTIAIYNKNQLNYHIAICLFSYTASFVVERSNHKIVNAHLVKVTYV